eukprot:410699_1
MSFKHYRKIVKNIMWQMVTVFEWLHETAHCCHLDIHSKNLMLTVQFIKQSDGCYKIDDGATVKLCDFGVSELCDLKTANYEKTKKAFELISRKLTIENEYLASPKAYEGEPFDCRSSDMWSLGMVFYQCLVGKQLYTPQDMWEIYLAIKQNTLKEYLVTRGIAKYFTKNSFLFLKELLKMDENKRLNAAQATKHKYFKKYYQIFQQNLKLQY